jgi:acyl-CoA dehydrogenase
MSEPSLMDLPSELQMLRETVRSFMRDEVKPLEDALPHDAYALPDEQLKQLQRKARALGLWNIHTPEEYGGAGLGLLGQCVVDEESSQCKMGAYVAACGAFGFDAPNIVYRGTRAQIEKYAIPSLEAGAHSFVAITEPSGGADPGRSIATRAERKGDRYILNGTKIFITGAELSDWGVVFARTGPGKGRDGITSFIVEKNRPGLTVRPVPVIRAWYPCELQFTDYEVPVENRLGEEGQGFKLAEEWLIRNRPPYAAATLGIASAALEIAIDWARQRNTFGAPLADRQAVQWMIADSEMEIRAARLLVHQAAARADQGQDIKIDASVCKVVGTETAGRVVDRCIQILGGMGVAREMPLERWYRELRIKRIGEGPSEVHRMVLARDLLGPRRKAN